MSVATKKNPKPTKIKAKLLFDFVKTIIEEGLEDEFLALGESEDFYISVRPRSMKIAADFLDRPGDRNKVLALAGASGESLRVRVCSSPTCDFE